MAPKKPTIQAITSPILLGNQATLRCVTTSTGTFTYVWVKAGSTTLSDTTQDLTFATLVSADLASYTCAVVESAVTSVTSDAFVLSETGKVSPAVSSNFSLCFVFQGYCVSCFMSKIFKCLDQEASWENVSVSFSIFDIKQ